MDKKTIERLESHGWRVGSVTEFLELSPEESQLVEIKLVLGDYLRDLRAQRGLTQTQVAGGVGSSQSRVAKMETADGSASLDLVLKTLFALGASPEDVGRVIATAGQVVEAMPSTDMRWQELDRRRQAHAGHPNSPVEWAKVRGRIEGKLRSER